MTIAIPSLRGGTPLEECLEGLVAQTFEAWEAVVIDNSAGRAEMALPGDTRIRKITATSNLGFGAAVNLGWRESSAEYLATINDDARADAGWLEAAVAAMDARLDAGMCASNVRLADGRTDSKGMLVARDGSSKQRTVGSGDALLPSGSAAVYRRRMIDEIGGFDESFFLYCEDTDLGLRARWAGWGCVYAEGAKVRHLYSASAGATSPVKARQVEQNRLRVAAKNFPWTMLWVVPFAGVVRYGWHLVSRQGAATRYVADGGSRAALVWLVVAAHLNLLTTLPRWIAARRRIRRSAKLSAREFAELMARHRISLREVAEA